MRRHVKTFTEVGDFEGKSITKSIAHQVEEWKADNECELYVLGEQYSMEAGDDRVTTYLTVTYVVEKDYTRLGVHPRRNRYSVRDGAKELVYRKIYERNYPGVARASLKERAILLRPSPLAAYYTEGSISLVEDGVWSLPDGCMRTVIADEAFSTSQDARTLLDNVFRVLAIGGTLITVEKAFGRADECYQRWTPSGLKNFLSVFRTVDASTVGNIRVIESVLTSGGSWPPMTKDKREELFSTSDDTWPLYIWSIAKK